MLRRVQLAAVAVFASTLVLPAHVGADLQAGLPGRGRARVVERARDRSGIASTLAALAGRRLTVRHGRVSVPRRRLSSLRFSSIDLFGNVESPRRVPRGG